MKNLILVIFFTLFSSLIFANTNNSLSIDYLNLEEVRLTQDFSNEYVFYNTYPLCYKIDLCLEIGLIVFDTLLDITDLEMDYIDAITKIVIEACDEVIGD